jgi:hypothetical protein
MHSTDGQPRRILIVAIEVGRWGPARLPHSLEAAGFRVAALCPPGNPLAATQFIDRLYPLCRSRSAVRLAKSIGDAIASWRPHLVVPADEQIVVLLQALVRQGISPGGLSAEALAVIADSLGRPDRFDAMLLKSETLALARRAGVLTPHSRTIASADEAVAAADTIGYPVYLKKSFSWAGNGITLCRDAAEIRDAMRQPRRWRTALKAMVRRALHRDWYPATTATDVQQVIAGTPAMYSCVAQSGALLGGFAGMKQQTATPTGPSTVVQLGPHGEMARAAGIMVGALGATGFLAFDFLIEETTGRAYLLECNPRPNQVCHLGGRVGVDLARALATGGTGHAAEPDRERLITLFPQEWLAQRTAATAAGSEADVPCDDPRLVAFMLRAIAQNWGRNRFGRDVPPSRIATACRFAAANQEPSAIGSDAPSITI